MQKKMKLKPFVISIIYVTVTISLIASLMILGGEILKVDTPINYITSSTITDDVKPVVKESKVFIKPYKDEDVKFFAQQVLDRIIDKDFCNIFGILQKY